MVTDPSSRDGQIYFSKIYAGILPAMLSLLHSSHVLDNLEHSLQSSNPGSIPCSPLCLVFPTPSHLYPRPGSTSLLAKARADSRSSDPSQNKKQGDTQAWAGLSPTWSHMDF